MNFKVFKPEEIVSAPFIPNVRRNKVFISLRSARTIGLLNELVKMKVKSILRIEVDKEEIDYLGNVVDSIRGRYHMSFAVIKRRLAPKTFNIHYRKKHIYVQRTK